MAFAQKPTLALAVYALYFISLSLSLSVSFSLLLFSFAFLTFSVLSQRCQMTLSSESGKCKMLPPTPPLTSHSPHLCPATVSHRLAAALLSIKAQNTLHIIEFCGRQCDDNLSPPSPLPFFSGVTSVSLLQLLLLLVLVKKRKPAHKFIK